MLGACDTHVHFYDGRHPAAPASVIRPPDATVDDYRPVRSALGTDRVVVVQPTTYGLDNTCQLAAMAALAARTAQGDAATAGERGAGVRGAGKSDVGGRGAGVRGAGVRGVMVVDTATPAAELARLTDLGVRGARFHMLPGGAVPWEALEPVAAAIAPFGWHVQLQLNGRELPERVERLLRLPVGLVIDHVGRFMPPVEPDSAEFAALLRLVDAGSWVKLSAPYESSVAGPPGYGDLAPLVDALVTRAPDRLVWASNWPHPGQASPPDPAALVALRDRWLPTDELRRRVLVDNPAELYGF